MLTLVYNSRPRQSTGVAPLGPVTPERVGSLLGKRMVASPAIKETEFSPRDVREAIMARLCQLIYKVRRSLSEAHRRYKEL